MVAFRKLKVDPVRLSESLADLLSPWEANFSPGNSFATPEVAARPLAIWEDDRQFVVELESPGISEEALNVTVHEGQLFVQGERNRPDAERRYWHDQLTYGSFEQRITLPETVDGESIKARLESGVLRITFAKKPESRPQRIEVKSG